MIDAVRFSIWAKNKICLKFPFTGMLDPDPLFGVGETSDILSFGFSYVEHEDHLVSHVIASPVTMKAIIRGIDEVKLSVNAEHIGELWTAKLHITDKVRDSAIVFSNEDFSVVLELDINKIT